MAYILRILLSVVAVISGIVLLTCTAIAYSRRENRSFWGGANMVTGWWLVTPYSSGGMAPGNDALVNTARISIAFFWLALLGIYAI